MRVIAVILIGRNTFLRIELANYDDSREEIERDAEELAKRLGGRYQYLEDLPCKQ